ncbi:MAG: RNA polymerase sigma-I factor [Clostridia bacterium]
MEYAQILTAIVSAKTGNEIIRQQLISNHKPFIINAVSHICKRYISWSDEEASIGLIAFNRSIDTFEPDMGSEFLSFSYLLIKRDIINYFRSNNKNIRYISIDQVDEESALTSFELEKSVQYYRQTVQQEELVEEILELDSILNQYGINFEELEEACPKHKDTREMIGKMVLKFVKDEEMVYEMTKKKRFPATVFLKRSTYPKKTVERFRKYIMTLIIINLHPEWTHLSAYIRI